MGTLVLCEGSEPGNWRAPGTERPCVWGEMARPGAWGASGATWEGGKSRKGFSAGERCDMTYLGGSH